MTKKNTTHRVVFFFGAYEADLKRATASHAHRALKPGATCHWHVASARIESLSFCRLGGGKMKGRALFGKTNSGP